MQSDSPSNQTDVSSVYDALMARLSLTLQQFGSYKRKQVNVDSPSCGHYGAADGAMWHFSSVINSGGYEIMLDGHDA